MGVGWEVAPGSFGLASLCVTNTKPGPWMAAGPEEKREKAQNL